MTRMDWLLAAGVACALATLLWLARAWRRAQAAQEKRLKLSPRDQVIVGLLELGMLGCLAGAMYLKEPDKPSLAFTMLVVCFVFVGGRMVVNLFKQSRRADITDGSDEPEARAHR